MKLLDFSLYKVNWRLINSEHFAIKEEDETSDSKKDLLDSKFFLISFVKIV